MIASHNQASIEYATEQMQKRGIQSKSDGVYFGQLLGMADHLSSVLGKNGYAAYKYVPFGLVQQVVPYLIRRAEENSSVLDGEGVAKERQMLWDELMRRFIPWRF